jgi:serine/threonine-protein kinase
VPTPELAKRALEAAEKTVSMAPDRHEGYLALGIYSRMVKDDAPGALEPLAAGLRLAPGNRELLLAMAQTEVELGRWEPAIEHFRQVQRLSPRSLDGWGNLSSALLRLRRYPEALEAQERGLALAPRNLRLLEHKAMSFLGQGDLRGARAVMDSAPKEVEPAALVAYFTNYNDLIWVLDEPRRDLLLKLTPAEFDDDRATWAMALAQAYALRGDAANVRRYAEEARAGFAEQLRRTPNDPGRRMSLAVSLAYLGRKGEAIREGERALALEPVTKDARSGAYYEHQLVRIHMLVGEHEKALDRLEPLLKLPYYLSPGWLAIDPNFDPLRKNPRFQRLVAGGR